MFNPSPMATEGPSGLGPNASLRDRFTPVAEAKLPTRFGNFRVVAFPGDPQGKEHLALLRGRVAGRALVPVRVHSECLTGDVLGSLRCDCRDQLITSLKVLGTMPYGVVLYLRQEGRGIGLTNKIKAYALQDQGHDTVEANRLLGFGDDERDYRVAALMLYALRVKSIRLMTNNPAKLSGLREYGIPVAGRIPLVVPPNRHSARYLETKQRRAGHWLSPLTPADADDTLSVSPLDSNNFAPVSDLTSEPSQSRRSNPCPSSK